MEFCFTFYFYHLLSLEFVLALAQKPWLESVRPLRLSQTKHNAVLFPQPVHLLVYSCRTSVRGKLFRNYNMMGGTLCL